MQKSGQIDVKQTKIVDPELSRQYLQLREEGEKLDSIENELDELISQLEDQKKDIFNNPDHSEYAYVTYEDLQKLPLWSNSKDEAKADQSLVIAIQTPHGSHLKISTGQRQTEGESKELYHLEIDAETGREGLPDDNITMYQV